MRTEELVDADSQDKEGESLPLADTQKNTVDNVSVYGKEPEKKKKREWPENPSMDWNVGAFPTLVSMFMIFLSLSLSGEEVGEDSWKKRVSRLPATLNTGALRKP